MFGFDPRMNYQRRRLLEAASEGHLAARQGELGERGVSRRVSNTPRVLENRNRRPRRSGSFEEYSNRRFKPRVIDQTKHALPFGKAIDRLNKQIDKASTFYTEFMNDYDRDIQPIKRYATVDVLNKLWRLRVTGKQDSRIADGGDEVIDDDETLKFKLKFRDMKLKVEKALDSALNSNLNEGEHHSRRSATRVDSGKRLKKKVDTAREQIVMLLDAAPETREKCRALINELELLKGLINSDLDNNKEMYKSDSDDFTEGTSDTENGYDEG